MEAISAGEFHNLALRADGTVEAWGEDSDGQATVPPDLQNVAAISGGGFHSLALLGSSQPVCSETGTSGSDTLSGTPDDDTICGHSGNDAISAGAGADRAYGNKGNDTVVGGPGADRIYGGNGFDVLRGNDGARGDYLNGGDGFDRCVIDRGDLTRNCEQTVERIP